MRNVDFYFYYKHSVRFIMLNKYPFLENTYLVPSVNKIICFFSLSKLEDFDDVQVYITFICSNFFLVVLLILLDLNLFLI